MVVADLLYIKMLNAADRFDPNREFVRLESFLPNNEVARYLSAADLFIFASSCENLPITLLEAMASGVVICSSNRGPMPEVLEHNVEFFDPESPKHIRDSIKLTLDNWERSLVNARALMVKAKNYSWERCAKETWSIFQESRFNKKIIK